MCESTTTGILISIFYSVFGVFVVCYLMKFRRDRRIYDENCLLHTHVHICIWITEILSQNFSTFLPKKYYFMHFYYFMLGKLVIPNIIFQIFLTVVVYSSYNIHFHSTNTRTTYNLLKWKTSSIKISNNKSFYKNQLNENKQLNYTNTTQQTETNQIPHLPIERRR